MNEIFNINSLSIIGLIYTIIIATFFFTKTKENSTETAIFSNLIAITIFEIIVITFCYVLKEKVNVEGLLYVFLNRLTLLFHALWPTLFLLYVFCIASKDSFLSKINSFFNKRNYIICFFILVLLTFLLDMDYSKENNMYIPIGAAVYFVYAIIYISIILMVVMLIIDRKNLKSKKYMPLYGFLAFSLIATIIQYINPELMLSTTVHCIIILMMYLTIENPDAKIAELEKQAAESAKAASEAKTAFLSSMSHELRTPLNAIVGLSEDITAYKDQVPEEVREDSEDIVNAADTLLEIVGNILDINKIEGGKLELIETDYNPKHEFESIAKIMRTKIKEKPLEFNTYIDEGLPEALFGDRLRIKQVINNFLSNAIKYTDEGKIDFSVRWISAIDTLQIIVSDTGRGVKPEDMDKLFEKFERLHVEKTSSVQGTGLGLSITKSLVELMNGQIHVESVYGKGSTFSVTIPQKIGDASKLEKLDTAKQTRLNTDYSGKKVLVVDDNSLNIKVLNKALKPFNFEIDECFDGKSAIDKINKNNYDIVFMDIMMPGMGGEEALSILKQNPDFHTPVVALTADATTGAKEKYLADGFTDYLAKPFTRDIIAQKLEKILK